MSDPEERNPFIALSGPDIDPWQPLRSFEPDNEAGVMGETLPWQLQETIVEAKISLILSLGLLQPDWDGAGASPPMPGAVAGVVQLLRAVYRFRPSLTVAAWMGLQAGPLPTGGLYLEWRLPGWRCQAGCDGEGKVWSLNRWRQTNETEPEDTGGPFPEGPFSGAQLVEELASRLALVGR